MADAIDIPVQILLMMQKYTRDARTVVKEASAMMTALKEVEQQAKKTGRSLENLKAGKVTLDVDTSAVNRAESDIQALDNLSPKIDVLVSVDEEQAQTELKSLDAPDLRVMVTADEEQAQSELNSLTAPDLKVEATADLSDVKKELQDIKNLARIQLVFDLAGTGLDVIQNVQNLPIVSGAQELDAALKQVQATTGQVIPDAEKLINDVFASGNWGATREEVAGVIAELSKFPELSGDLAGSATTAFEVMQVTGTDFEGTLDALRNLVANGLAPDVQSAGDLIVTTFQKGGNVAGDAIDTIREYSSQFAQAGIDGATAMDLIIQGLQLGTRDGDKLADTFKELGIRLTTAVDDMAGAEFDALQAAGLFDEAKAVQAGEMTGTAFAQAAIAALEAGEATEQNLFDIFGTPLEDFGIDIFKNLDFAAASEAIIPEGAATEAAALLNDNLGAAFQNLGRVLETSVIEKLKAAGIDINDFLQKATDKLYTIAGLIGDGVAFPDAIAIALDNPELGEQLRTLEAVLGNFIIELLTAFANIGEGLGADVSGIREFVAGAGATQFAYDIAVDPSNMEHVEFAIQQALRRGVDGAEIGELVARAGQDLINRGDIEGAQELLETVQAIPGAFADVRGSEALFGEIQDFRIEFTPETVAEGWDAMQAEIDKQLAERGLGVEHGREIQFAPTVDTTALEGLLFGAQSDLGATAATWMDNLLNFAQQEIVPPLSDQDAVNLAAGALATGDIATALDAANRAGWPITEADLQTLADSSEGFYELHNKLTEYTFGLQDAERDGTAAMQTLVAEGIDPANTAQDDLSEGVSLYVLGLIDQLEIAKVTWQDYADYVNNDLTINPPTGTTPPGAPPRQNYTGGVMSPGFNSVGERGTELLSTNTALAVLNNMTTEALMRGVGMAMGGNTSNTTNIFNFNVTNNNANQAAAISGADRLSANLRGVLMAEIRKLQFWNNVLSANTLGAGSILPQNAVPVVFDFKDASSPWVLQTTGAIPSYRPGVAGLKNGGLTTESSLSDGKVWQATPFDTIQDTIVLVPGGNSTPNSRADFMSKLLLLQRQANAYQIQSSEYRPVNCCVNEVGDAGDRFSQIYDIQWAIDGDMFTEEFANLSLTLTITRYPYWTPIPLGTNPKWYTFLARGLDPSEFLVPSELALNPTDISAYAISTTGAASSFTTPQEGYTPDIGFGDDVIDWVSGTNASGTLLVGNVTPDEIAPVEASTAYKLTFWIRSESSSYDAVPLRVIVFDQSGNTITTGSNFTVTVTANWVMQETTFTTGVGDTGIYFSLGKNTSATNASYDIYGISVKASANPLALTDYGNADADLQSWIEEDVENIWTRTDVANMRLNYIDIDAADIPGDVPALLSMVVDRQNTNQADGNFYVARRLDCLDDEALYTMTFMAQGSTLVSPTGVTSTYQSDNGRGITSTPGGAASARYAMQFVTGAGAISSNQIARWEFQNLPQGGKFAAFLRGGLTAGAAADIPMFLQLTTTNQQFIISTASRTLNASASANAPALTYMGVLDATQIKNAIRLADGLGVNSSEYELRIMFGGRTAGAAATYRVTDVLLIPYDDLFMTIADTTLVSTSDVTQYIIYDSSGYFNQNAAAIALGFRDWNPPLADTYEMYEIQGQVMTLEPNRNNRLYFLLGDSQASPTNDSTLTFVTLRTRLNMIPRWRRWRSV